MIAVTSLATLYILEVVRNVASGAGIMAAAKQRRSRRHLRLVRVMTVLTGLRSSCWCVNRGVTLPTGNVEIVPLCPMTERNIGVATRAVWGFRWRLFVRRVA